MDTKSEAIARFQDKVSETLLLHRSILDSLSKYQEAASRVNRALVKTVTYCGCLSINARKQHFPLEASLCECRKYLQSHLEGNLCEHCREVIEEKIGSSLFYLAAICHLLGLSLEEIIDKELKRLDTLGHFRLS
ncbi:MAG: DUF1573 domain-containing protein [Firmicutes bacterium]|nr:DUF1573 domain-containing protein [Bacillota bacterium]